MLTTIMKNYHLVQNVNFAELRAKIPFWKWHLNDLKNFSQVQSQTSLHDRLKFEADIVFTDIFQKTQNVIKF